MNRFKIVYYFDHGFSASQIVESDSRENVIKNLVEEGVIEISNENNIYHKFNMEDVKLINVIVMEPDHQATF
jgi:homoaconitase/3-isopropylmalate dehydratase large subunit